MPFSISATFHITMALCDYYRGCKLSLNCRWTWSISSFGGLKVVALKAEGLRCWPKTSASLLLWAVGDPLLHVSPHLSLFPYFILALCSLTVKGFETCPQRLSPHVFLLYPHACKWCLCAMEMCQNRLDIFFYTKFVWTFYTEMAQQTVNIVLNLSGSACQYFTSRQRLLSNFI